MTSSASRPHAPVPSVIQQIADEAPVGITVADLDGRFRMVNRFATNWVRRDAEEVIGHTAHEFLSAKLADAVSTAERHVRATQRPERVRIWSDPPRGDPSLLEITVFPLFDENGALDGTGTVYDDITAQDQALRALRKASSERRALLDRLVDAQEHERAHIAADIHDDSVQAMAAVALRLTVLRHRLDHDAKAAEDLDALHETIAAAMQRLRQLLFDLEPPGADESLTVGLHAAATFIFAGSRVECAVVGEDADLPYGERVTAIRIAREALTNVRKHARARTVTVAVHAKDGGVEIEIGDDGIGIDPSGARSAPGHRGVRTMADRAAVAGGWWQIERGRRHGTVVRYWLPGSA